MDLKEHADQAVAAIRKTPPPPEQGYRLMGYGTLKTGAMIGQTKFWPVRTGEFIRGEVIPDDGVLIQYGDFSVRYIKNSFYDDINLRTL